MRGADKRAALASGVALAALGVVSARQLGLLARLPDLPWPLFQSDRLVTSPGSRILGLPDGPLGLGSFALTLLLTLRGSPLAKVKSALDVTYALGRSGSTYAETGELCGWCLLALGASVFSALSLWGVL